MDAPSSTDPVKKHVTPISALLFAGIGLIGIAIVVIVTASWQSFSPLGRISATLIPLILLYVAGMRTRTSSSNFGHYLLVAATALLPFVTGTVLTQAGFGTVQDSGFLLLISLVTLSASLILEFSYGETLHTAITIISLVLIPQFATQVLWPNYSVDYPLAAVISAVSLILVAGHVQEKERSNAYATIGMLAAAFGLLFFPSLLFSEEPFGLPSVTLYVAEGVATSLLAVAYSTKYLEAHQPYVLIIRRTLEQISPLLLIGPLLTGSVIHSGEPLYALLLVVLGVLLILLSVSVSVQSVKVFGYGGLITGLFFLLVLVTGALQASWPIILLVVGFLFIAVAYFLQHRSTMHISLPHYFGKWEQALAAMGTNEHVETRETRLLLGPKTPEQRSNDSLILIVAILVIAMVYALFSQYVGGRRESSSYHGNTMMN